MYLFFTQSNLMLNDIFSSFYEASIFRLGTMNINNHFKE